MSERQACGWLVRATRQLPDDAAAVPVWQLPIHDDVPLLVEPAPVSVADLLRELEEAG